MQSTGLQLSEIAPLVKVPVQFNVYVYFTNEILMSLGLTFPFLYARVCVLQGLNKLNWKDEYRSRFGV